MKYHLTFLMFFSQVLSFAQQADSIPEKQQYDFILLNSKFNNSFTFLGRDFGQTIPLLSTDLMFYSNSGIYLNGSAIKFIQDDIPWQFSGTVGYMMDLSNKVDLNLSYSQFIVSQSNQNAGIQNLSFLQGTMGLDWTILYSSIQVQALFNENTDLFISSHHSRYFEFNGKLFNSFVVSFEPRVSFLGGSSNFYLMGGYTPSENELLKLKKIQLLSVEGVLPVTFSAGNFELELQAKYVAPINLPAFDDSRSRMIFGAQLLYVVPIKRK
jgi:hypothetical protein